MSSFLGFVIISGFSDKQRDEIAKVLSKEFGKLGIRQSIFNANIVKTSVQLLVDRNVIFVKGKNLMTEGSLKALEKVMKKTGCPINSRLRYFSQQTSGKYKRYDWILREPMKRQE